MLKQLLEHSLCNHHSSKMQTFIPKGIYANNFDVSGRTLSSAAGMDSQNRCKMKTNVLWDLDSPLLQMWRVPGVSTEQSL